MRHPHLDSSSLTSLSSSHTRSVATSTGHLVYRFQEGCQILFKGWGLAGFAFIYMEDERDAEDAIRGLDRVEFGRKGRRLRVEWTKQERGIRRPGGTSRRSTNTRPSKTLFVINFDPHHTRTKDLERHFEPYGRIVSVRIRRNFAFVQYEVQEDATKALDATNLSKLLDRVISVEYAVRDDDERKDGYSPDRSRDRSPDRRGHDRRRSPSPYRRERGSPDYGRGPSPYRKERGSPDYGRRRSPSPYRRDRASPDYGRGTSRSPYRRERAGSDHGHGPSRSPYHRDKVSPVNGHGPSDSPYQREERISPENGRGPSRSPYRRERSNQGHGRGSSRSPYGRERPNPDNGRGSSRSPNERDGDSPENGQLRSPSSIPDERDSPNGGAESPMRERYRRVRFVLVCSLMPSNSKWKTRYGLCCMVVWMRFHFEVMQIVIYRLLEGVSHGTGLVIGFCRTKAGRLLFAPS
ncbi:hypothetical protein D5086_027558 [Populus alba]|uniref:Uncharacterized protein n=1 Tax=Populus alba TaxID=43335 RepID=A0ACC4AVN4_POPAL